MSEHTRFETFGVVLLAAGASRRMGTCKLLLPWKKETVLAHLLNQWRKLGAAQISPVVDPSNQLLEAALIEARLSCAEWIENPLPKRGMFSSLQEASRCKRWRSGLTHWVIALGDQPTIHISTLRLLLETAQQNPSRICQPVFGKRAAHPIILPAELFLALVEDNAPDLRTFIRKRDGLRLRIPVDDAGVTIDLDTPADYARWVPTGTEAISICK
ncbi:MAG: nucleotidyltransferase family protein [Verrucomicrobiota bacterium]|nr:nucleotidyltransferase family protein [Verrucomicrobiota bacterium]MDQ3625617.1 nucleotidyltransferase family protein [Verrucomicrobiota bacterium]